MEIAALVLAGLAITLTVGIEWAKRPRLEIRPSRFRPSGPIAWTFAAVQVQNKPLRRPWSWFLTRQTASGCRVTIDFFRWATGDRAFTTVPGRWSAHPEPLRHSRRAVSPAEAGAAQAEALIQIKAGRTEVYTAQYDPSLDPREHDVRASEDGDEVAVAVLTTAGAYAWGTESYAYPGWGKPEWEIERGTYRVVVRLDGAGISKEATFKLEYLDEDFAKFRLVPT